MAIISGRIPLLNGKNFSTWLPQMEAVLQKNRLLRMVRNQEAKPEVVVVNENATVAEKKLYDNYLKKQREYEDADQDARAEIIIALDPEVVRMVKNIKTSHEIWLYLRDTYDRKSTRKKAELYRKLLNLQMAENQNISQYLVEFDVAVSELREMVNDLDEDFLKVLLLDGLSSKYKSVKAAFDTANEFPTLNVIRSRLLEIGDKPEEVHTQDNALKVFKYQYGNKKKHGNFNNMENKGMKFPFNCHNCGKKGHMAKNCKVKINKANEAYESSGFVFSTLIGNSSLVSSEDSFVWVVDSGASSHMTSIKSAFINIDETFRGTVRLADDKNLEIMGIGTAQVNVKVRGRISTVNLLETLYIPNLKSNLFSIGKATDNGCRIKIFSDKIVVYKNGNILISSQKNRGIYCFHSIRNYNDRAMHVEKSKSELELWHKRFGHLNPVDLEKLQSQEMVFGLPKFKTKRLDCISCIRGKQIRQAFPKKNTKTSTEILQLIHTDLCGPMRVESIGKKLYFATFIDDFTRKVYVRFLRKKSEYLELFKDFKKQVELETGRKIKSVRSDNASELKSREFEGFLKGCGITRQFSVEYTPEQNGLAERMNRTLVEMARTTMIEAKLPEFLWAELIMTASYLRNRCPTKLNNNKTPEELWSGKKPSIKHLRQIGSKAFVLDKRPGKSKWQPRSSEFVLVGYSTDAKAYRLWKRSTREIIKSRDVRFIEDDFSVDISEIENEQVGFYDFNWNANERTNNNLDINQRDFEVVDAINRNQPMLEYENQLEQENPNQILTEDDYGSISTSSNESVTYEPSIRERLRSWSIFKSREEANIIIGDRNDPKTYKEMLKSEHVHDWKLATEEEYRSIMMNSTWELVDLPKGRKPIGCKWVFKTKYTPDGKIDKRKARLVAKGYSQEYGVDYNSTFAPVIRQSSLRLIYALAVEKDLKLRQLDVSTAFLNGNLDEKIFMAQPEGFIDEMNRDKVCLLKKSIYGLKQASRQWYKKIDSVLKEFNLNKSKYDQCIYSMNSGKDSVIIALYVDDIIIASSNETLTNRLIALLSNNFEIRDMKDPKHCIGLEISQKPGSLTICQPAYIQNLIEKYGLTNAKTNRIPMQFKINLEKEPKIPGEEGKIDKTKFQEIIGSLLHLAVFSRPDISCSVNRLSQFCQDPRKQHWNAALAVIRYLKSTKDYVIMYKKTNSPLVGFVDANWAQDCNDRKSQSGFCFIFAGAAISWESRKQRVVATSSAEAEYMALTECAKEAMYLRYVLEEFGYAVNVPTTIMCDSQSAQHMANFGSHHSRTKHIHYRYHFIRDAVENGTVKLEYLPTDKMIADMLTKPVPKIKHQFCIKGMGMTSKND